MPPTLPPPDPPEKDTKDRNLWRSALVAGSLPRRGLRVLSGQGAREGYLAAVDQGAISIANFAATIILARAITPTDLGVYGVGFTALRLVRSVQEGLTIQPINTYGAGMDAESFRRYATSTSLIQIGLALLSSGAVALTGWILTEMGNDTAGPAMFSLWFVFLFWQLQEYIRRLLYTRSAVFNAVVNTLLANAVRIGLLLLWANRQQINGIAGLDAIAWGSLAALVPGLWQTRRYWTPHFSELSETWKRNWDFGRWVMGGTIANWISVEFYPVLTAGMISFAAAGAYRALQNLVAPIHLLLRATDTFLTPRAARQFTANGYRALARTLRLVYLVSGLPILGLLSLAILFPVPILRLLYGETYVGYSSGMVLMAIFYALWYAYWPLQTAFKAARISRPIFIANLSAMAVMFTAGIWAITRWGVYGTIAGQALNALVVALILWWSWMGVRRASQD
jgi:O-antigen/teichoic acid export membrane protein